MFVVVADHNINLPDGEQIPTAVASILVHPEWNSTNSQNDFAILGLASTLVTSPADPNAGIACLPPDVTQTFEGASLTVSGWGSTVGGSFSPSSVLRAANLRVTSNTECASRVSTPLQGLFGDSVMCALGTDTSSSFCNFDNGGNN
jgi:hypothetical protein